MFRKIIALTTIAVLATALALVLAFNSPAQSETTEYGSQSTGAKVCERLDRWRDQILREKYRPAVHHALANEAYSMACGPL